MDPVTRLETNHSTRSYLERELIVSIGNDGPMIGPSLEVLDTHDEHDTMEESISVDSVSTISENGQALEKQTTRKWWQIHKKSSNADDPRQYSNLKKNMILFIVSSGGLVSPISTTLYYPAIVTMQNYFNTTDTAMNASLSVFTFFTAFFPIIWATCGDLYGRRRIYMISFLISVIGSVCCALSVNVEMFIVFRAVGAIGSSSAMSMGAGTIADIYEPKERGRAFAYYTCGPLLGPAIGPIIGGYLNKGLGWRSDFWFLAIYTFCVWLAMVFILPETWRPSYPAIQQKQHEPSNVSTETKIDASKIEEKDPENQTKKSDKKKRRKVFNPFGALSLLKYPNIALTVTFVGILFFVLYLNSTTFTRSYTNQYGFDSGIVGLCYLPNAAGSMIGGILSGRLSDRVYNKKVQKAQETGGEIYPEMRLGGAIIYVALVIQLLAFIAYGWCIQKNVHFAYGLVAEFFIGFALMLPNITLSAYMVDCFKKQGASVTACNNFARYLMAGIGSLIASDIEKGMGDGPLFTFCGCLFLVAGINLVIVKRYPLKWQKLREKSSA